MLPDLQSVAHGAIPTDLWSILVEGGTGGCFRRHGIVAP